MTTHDLEVPERGGPRTLRELRWLVDCSPHPTLMVDSEGSICDANPRASELLATTGEALLGRPLASVLSEPRASELLGRASGAHERRWPHVRRADAREVPVRADAAPYVVAEGAYGLITLIDLSELRNAEQTCDRMVSLVNSADDAIITKDLDGIVQSWNPGAERLLGYRAEEMIGKSIVLLLPEDRVDEEAMILERLRRGEAINNFQSVRVCKDGTRRTVSLTISPLRDRFGAIMGAAKIMRDLGEQVRVEERFQAVVEAAANAFLLVDASGTIVLVNRKAELLFGYDRAELVGHPVDRLIPAHARGHHPEEMARFARAPVSRPMGIGRDLFACRKDGTLVAVEIGLSPLQVRGKLYTLASIVDISERKRAETELRRSNAELEQFAYIASHDLQEPLRMVASFTQLLAERYRGQLDATADQYIHFAVDGALRMRQLIHDLLAFSGISSQGAPLQPVSADDVLEAVLEQLQPELTALGAVIEHDPLPSVWADRQQLSRVFHQLIDNSLKFRSEAPPRLEVRVQRDAHAWIFSVKDNGIGIDMKYSERIFLMFQRLHERGRFPGSGIGLTLVKRIVERHGGRVFFESTPGQGSTFSFSVPAREVEAAQ